jgi:SOS-response transcriptional repressor LexA
MALGKNIKAHRQARGWEQKTLSSLSGVEIGTISALEVRDSKRSDKAPALARAFGISTDELITGLPIAAIGTDAVDVANRRAIGQEQSNVSDYKPKHRVPLISWVQAGGLSDVEDLFHPGEAVRWEDTDANCSRSTYALLVDGDSMVCTVPGMPSFPPGTVLVVDPERGGNAGDYVIAKDVHSQRATFKLLKTDGARWYLHALNKEYPAIEIDDPALRVIGRVIEAKPPTIKLI